MRKDELISIIVPAYNEENRIKKCIDSLTNQTYKNLEIIVVNDGSTDSTLQVLKKIKDPRLKVITIKNHGQGYARNIGIKKSNGNLVSFVDSDDYVNKNMIEKLYNNMIENDSDIVVCNIMKKYGSNTEPLNNYKNYFEDQSINHMISHPGPVARLYNKKLFIDNNIYFLENCIYEDLGTIPLLGIYTDKISYVDEFLYYYIIRENSSMNQKKYSKKLEDIFTVINHLTEQYSNRTNKYKEVLEYLTVEHLLYSANLRFLEFDIGKERLNFISHYMKKNYPNWRKNIIYKKKSIKFKLFCILAYKKLYMFCKILKILGGKK